MAARGAASQITQRGTRGYTAGAGDNTHQAPSLRRSRHLELKVFCSNRLRLEGVDQELVTAQFRRHLCIEQRSGVRSLLVWPEDA